jgi:hypothetical protein
MTLTLDMTLAALIAVPCIIALASGSGGEGGGGKVIAALMLVLAVLYGVAPTLLGQFIKGDIPKYLALAVGVMSIVACVRIAHGIYSTLIVTAGCLIALVKWGIIATG